MKTTKFETGNIYEMTFITDSDLRVKFICVHRTAKTVTLERFQGTERLTRRVFNHDNVEYIKYDTYSLAPVIKSSKLVG